MSILYHIRPQLEMINHWHDTYNFLYLKVRYTTIYWEIRKNLVGSTYVLLLSLNFDWFSGLVLENAMATHSGTLAWKIPWTEEPAVHGVPELDMAEWLHFYFSLPCIGEGNGNPLQCSCLENPRDGGAWWAAVSRVAQSQTRLKRLSSSSSMYIYYIFNLR